jgi:hypothetical protein
MRVALFKKKHHRLKKKNKCGYGVLLVVNHVAFLSLTLPRSFQFLMDMF